MRAAHTLSLPPRRIRTQSLDDHRPSSCERQRKRGVGARGEFGWLFEGGGMGNSHVRHRGVYGWIRFAVAPHRRDFFILRLLLVRSLVYLAWARTACPASAASQAHAQLS